MNDSNVCLDRLSKQSGIHSRVALLAVALFALASGTARAGDVLNPIAVAGYDYDAVVENTTTSFPPTTAQGLDLDNRALLERGWRGQSNGMPSGGAISVSAGTDTIKFQLAPYGTGSGLSDNALKLNGDASLNLAAPSRFAELAVLGFSTNAQSSNGHGDVILHFSDGTTSDYANAFYAPDWFAGGPNVAYVAGSRVSLNTGDIDGNGSVPDLYYSLISLSPADMAKTVSSVEFTQPEGAGFSYVMAVSGTVPEPAALVSMTVGCAFILLYIRRRRSLRS